MWGNLIYLATTFYLVTSYPTCEDGTHDLIADPENCAAYYKCVDGEPILENCDEGLHFNSNSKICEEGVTGNCVIKEQPSPTTEDSTLLTTPSSSCSDYPPNKLLQDPDSCNKYYSCGDEGIAYLNICPGGLHFNPGLEICDWPENVNCKNGSVASPPQWPEECRAENEGTMSPDPEDCQIFYVCSHQEWYNLTCPNGTLYNPLIKVCDWPNNVHCPGDESSTEANICLEASTELVSDVVDCGKFYSCVDGRIPISMNCPDGLHFNLELQLCDWPDLVNCTTEQYTTETTTTVRITSEVV